MNGVADSFVAAGELSKDVHVESLSLAQRLINIPGILRRVLVPS